jgi:hypothetical protein
MGDEDGQPVTRTSRPFDLNMIHEERVEGRARVTCPVEIKDHRGVGIPLPDSDIVGSEIAMNEVLSVQGTNGILESRICDPLICGRKIIPQNHVNLLHDD